MKARAALALKAGAPLVIDEVEVAGPKAGEVLVQMVAVASVTPMPLPYRAMIPKGSFLRF